MGMKIDWKQRKNQLVLLLLAGILLLVIALPVKEKEGKLPEEKTYRESGYEEKEYGAEMERKLENILREVEGAGYVKVMITFQSTSEKILEKDGENNTQVMEEEDNRGGKRKTDDRKSSETTVYDNGAGGEQTPYVTKELRPKVEGVVVIAGGGDNPVVIKNITEAVQALFGVETHKIKVMKRNQTN